MLLFRVQGFVIFDLMALYFFKGGKTTANSDLPGIGDEFQIQAEKNPSSSNKGKVIKR